MAWRARQSHAEQLRHETEWTEHWNQDHQYTWSEEKTPYTPEDDVQQQDLPAAVQPQPFAAFHPSGMPRLQEPPASCSSRPDMLSNVETPFWLRSTARRLGDWSGQDKPEHERLGVATLVTPTQAARQGMSREAYQNIATRTYVKYSAIAANPEQYLQYVLGLPCLFIVVSFEGATVVETENYLCSKWGVKVLVVMSRWGKADDDESQSGEGAFMDCMKEIILPFLDSNVFPEDTVAFVFEEDWRLSEKDAAVSAMRCNQDWAKLLRQPPDNAFCAKMGQQKDKMTPDEFLMEWGRCSTCWEVEPFDDVAGEAFHIEPVEGQESEIEEDAPRECGARVIRTTASAAVPKSAFRRAGRRGSVACEGTDACSPLALEDTPLTRSQKKRKLQNENEPCHRVILDSFGHKLTRPPAPSPAQHVDVLGLVSLQIQALEKKVGNIVSYSIQCGRGKDHSFLYSGKPKKYSFSNALTAYTKAGGRACAHWLSLPTTYRSHFDGMLAGWLSTERDKVPEQEMSEYYKALSPRKYNNPTFEAEWFAFPRNLEKVPSLGDALQCCFVVPSVGHFLAHQSGCTAEFEATDLPPFWDPRHTGETLSCGSYYFCPWLARKKGQPLFLRNDWTPDNTGTTLGQHEQRASMKQDVHTEFQPSMSKYWWTQVPPWIPTTTDLLDAQVNSMSPWRIGTDDCTPVDCEESDPASWGPVTEGAYRRRKKFLGHYFTLRYFSWTWRPVWAHWTVAKATTVPQRVSYARPDWRGYLQPMDRALQQQLQRDDTAFRLILDMYKRWYKEFLLRHGSFPHLPTQQQWKRDHPPERPCPARPCPQRPNVPEPEEESPANDMEGHNVVSHGAATEFPEDEDTDENPESTPFL